ncbi:hypothetical protein TNCV_797181 [Trichonephila clavipes]|uniref:Uncharacterized protein n=1 Tax=Trichonephila clavipes TaxID=2585209 RepID=A0A8X6WJE0_TRICX|nr:hypothetical protein TNCV_797181 [Trichonephila clavipes]
MQKESEPAVENYSEESYVGNYGNLYITDAYVGVGMNTPFAAKVHAATLARRNTMTVAVAPFYNVVDGSLQLPFNHAHIRAFTTDLKVIDIKEACIDVIKYLR